MVDHITRTVRPHFLLRAAWMTGRQCCWRNGEETHVTQSKRWIVGQISARNKGASGCVFFGFIPDSTI
jgi:hypothetical protein